MIVPTAIIPDKIDLIKCELKLNLDKTAYKQKPLNTAADDEVINRLVTSLKSKSAQVSIDANELFIKITRGHTFTYALLKDKNDKGFISSRLIVLDFDNEVKTMPIMREPEAVEKLKAMGINPVFVYPSFSYTKEKPKFRTICILNETVDDPAIMKRIHEGIIQQFPYEVQTFPNLSDPNKSYSKNISVIDRGATALSQMFYGTCHGYYPELCGGEYTDLDTALQLYREPERVTYDIPCRPNTYTSSTPASELYATAPLLNYITQSFNITRVKGGGDQYRISPCVVCGGDEMTVNTAKGQWHCHRTKEGGTIYKIMTEYQGMTPDQARDEVKRLHGIDPEQERREYAKAREQAEREEYYRKAEPPPPPPEWENGQPPDEPGSQPRKLKVFRADQIEKKDQFWLWYPYFPEGAVCSMVGVQNVGKSFVMLRLAAAIAKGEELPGERLDYFYNPRKKPRNVLLFMCEDDPNRTVKKRLDEVADAETQKNIYLVPIGNGEKISMVSPEVEDLIRELNPALVVFDPVQAYMPAGIDMNNQISVRDVLNRLISMATRHNTTILYTQHMNKQTTQSALYRANGSNELTAAPRTSVLLGFDPEDKYTKVMAITKANLVKQEHQKSLAFRIDTAQFPAVEWIGTTELEADDVCSVKRNKEQPPGEEYKPAPKKDAAQEFLIDLLESNEGFMTVKQIEKAYTAAGHSRGAIYRAHNSLKNLGLLRTTDKGSGKTVFWFLDGYEPPQQQKQKGI